MYRRFGLALAVAVLAAACSVIDPSQNQVKEFTGTLQPGSAQQTPDISISKTGELTVTVTSLTPPVPLGTFFGIILGQVTSNTCQAFSNNQFATVGSAAISQRITPGTWCIVIYDPRGIFSVPEAWVMRVSHP